MLWNFFESVCLSVIYELWKFHVGAPLGLEDMKSYRIVHVSSPPWGLYYCTPNTICAYLIMCVWYAWSKNDSLNRTTFFFINNLLAEVNFYSALVCNICLLLTKKNNGSQFLLQSLWFTWALLEKSQEQLKTCYWMDVWESSKTFYFLQDLWHLPKED